MMDESTAGSANGGFAALFDEAEKRIEFWEEDAIISFTEEVCTAMERTGVSRAELARRLGASPAYVTKVLRGNANFTIRSMVRLAAALDLQLGLGLAAPRGGTYQFDPQRGESRQAASLSASAAGSAPRSSAD